MDLYQITIDDKKDPNPSELNSCGKTVNTLLKEVVEKAEVIVSISFNVKCTLFLFFCFNS